MTDRYVGPGGSDTNDGSTWANRKETLGGVEAIVGAGDTVYIGPGVYRESVATNADGTSGNNIVYYGDVTGENTDGVGGVIRWTGLDSNDQSVARANCIQINNGQYREFRNIRFEYTSSYLVVSGSWVWEFYDCVFIGGTNAIYETQGATTIRYYYRCMFLDQGDSSIYTNPVINVTMDGIIESCVFKGTARSATSDGAYLYRNGGYEINNCTFIGLRYGVYAGYSSLTLRNSLFIACNYGVYSPSYALEVNNGFSGCDTNKNLILHETSREYVAYLGVPILSEGYMPHKFSDFEQSKNSPYLSMAGNTMGSDYDLYGLPVVGQGIGATENYNYAKGNDGIYMADGQVYQAVVPVTNTSTTISVEVKRGTGYAGAYPAMVIIQPGSSNRTNTDTGSSGTWNTLSDTFTPTSATDYVIIQLQSLNGSTTGDHSVEFRNLSVS